MLAMYQQLYDRFDSFLLPKQCNFHKGHSAQNCLMVMLVKFKESGIEGTNFAALFTELSKEFNNTDHNLLITRPSSYGITTKSLNLTFSNLRNRT